MVTVHLLTKNNAQTIRRTLESLIQLNSTIMIGDLGSSDETTALCRANGAHVYNLGGMQRDEARNYLISQTTKGHNFYIEPWEFIMQGWSEIVSTKTAGDVRVMQGTSVNCETRIWKEGKFINPVFERLNVEGTMTGVVLFSDGGPDITESLQAIEAWKIEKPLSAAPHYYQACLLFAQGRYNDFLQVADYYLFMDKEQSMSTIMTRYYYAMTQVLHKKSYKPALQNLNLCLCAKPLMAEFWCLMGDVYYHLLDKFGHAKEFYENAILLGSKRLQTDRWPMDFSKYNKYPRRMIESCDKIMGTATEFAKISKRNHQE